MGGDRNREASGQADSEVIVYSYSLVDEETNTVLSFLMICGCGFPAYLYNEDETFFYCDHCDRPCAEPLGECELCIEHYKFDAEKTRKDYYDELGGEGVDD
jgi:hypothetical protein